MPLIERVQPFLAKYAEELQQCPGVERFLIWGCALSALEHGDRRLARSILFEHRLFPSFWRKPRAFNVWLKCLAAGPER